MRSLRVIAVLLVLVTPFAFAKGKTKKQAQLSSLFSSAHYVYVQAEDGDIMRPGLFSEDRDAISAVQEALREWNRYALTTEREHADLVIVVRKGRAVGLQGRGGISAGSPGPERQPGTQMPGHNPGQAGGLDDSDNLGARSEVGPSDDLLRVFALNSDGKRTAALWARELKDGLDGPSVVLVQQLKDAVERAYPSNPPAKQPAP
jgi:hypothetical protein